MPSAVVAKKSVVTAVRESVTNWLLIGGFYSVCLLWVWWGIGVVYFAVVAVVGHTTWMNSIDHAQKSFKAGNYSDAYNYFKTAETQAKTCPIAFKREGLYAIASNEGAIANESVGIDTDNFFLEPSAPSTVCAAAVPLYKQCLRIGKEKIDHPSPYFWLFHYWPEGPSYQYEPEVRLGYIKTLHKIGRIKESESECLTLISQLSPPDLIQDLGQPELLLPAKLELASIYQSQAQSAKAEVQYRGILEECKKGQDEKTEEISKYDDDDVVNCLAQIAKHFEQSGRSAESCEIHKLIEKKLAAAKNDTES